MCDAERQAHLVVQQVSLGVRTMQQAPCMALYGIWASASCGAHSPPPCRCKSAPCLSSLDCGASSSQHCSFLSSLDCGVSSSHHCLFLSSLDCGASSSHHCVFLSSLDCGVSSSHHCRLPKQSPLRLPRHLPYCTFTVALQAAVES